LNVTEITDRDTGGGLVRGKSDTTVISKGCLSESHETCQEHTLITFTIEIEVG